MLCTLSVFACIEDVSRVITLLSDPPAQHGENDEQGDWEMNDEDWSWDAAAGQASPTWLQDCCISLSPATDMLALARNGKAVFLTSKWDSHADSEPKTKFEIIWSGRLAGIEEGECVTDILCVPLASQHRSSQGAPDWTCVVMGFTSGYMRIYLQNGSLLLSQLLHDDPVLRFKCRSWQPHTNYRNAEQVEELAILYPSSLVIIDGFSLYQSLRACRNQLARAQASGSQELIQPPPLAYKKWRFEGQKIITDIASCGVVTPNLFDQLETASFIGGFHASIRGSAPASSHYVSTGLEPFVAVYSAIEGSSPSLISDVALAVASKLTTAVLSKLSAASGWLGWGGKPAAQAPETSKPAKPKVEKGTLLPARYGLPDFRRHGNTITLAPNGKVAVTTDDFGRVMLLDVKTGVVTRLWKGYREAECGWVMVQEDENGEERNNSKPAPLRTVLFLVIYAAKRGILEVWRTEQGPRVAAFNVGKDCRLLYAGHGIMGLCHVMKQGQAPPQHTLNCLLLQGDGALKTISVPFHCALSDKHSRRVRDLHLLKKLSALLDEARLDQDSKERQAEELEKSAKEVLVDLQTPQLQQQGLQCLLSTASLPSSLLLRVVSVVRDTILKRSRNSEDTGDELEDVQSLFAFCHVQTQLLQTYITLAGLPETAESGEQPWRGKSKELLMAQILGVTKSEAVQLLSSLERYWQLDRSPTEQRSDLSVTSFLGCFEGRPVNTDSPRRGEGSVGNSQPGPAREIRKIHVRGGLSTTLRLQLASFLFEEALSGSCVAEKLHLPLDSSGIDPAHLMDLLCCLWLSGEQSPRDLVRKMADLHSMLHVIMSLAGSLGSGDTDLSAWGEMVRTTLAQSSSVGRALVLAAVSRSVAMEISTANKKVQSDEEEAESLELAAGDWVAVSAEVERWNLLVCQLTDLLALRCFMLTMHTAETDQRTNEQLISLEGFSVVGFLASSYGAASKFLSRCVVRHDIPPQALGQPRPVTRPAPPDEDPDHVPDEDRPEPESEPAPHPELPGLSDLRTRFPHSLQPDVLWSHCALECATVWDRDKEQTDKLIMAVDHISCVHCNSLRHGLSVILWKKYFKEKISATVMLMEKVGKAPKDRLCRKTVNLSYGALEQFLKAARRLLQIVLQTDPSDSEVLILGKEDFWQSGEDGARSLIEEAGEQPMSNVSLVELHHKLVLILWIVMGVEMKSVKPLTLFDPSRKAALMKDLSSSVSLPSGAVDQAVADARQKFLMRALSFVVTSMTHKQSDPVPRGDGSETSHPVATAAAEWPPVVFLLAEQFGIDADSLRRHHVVELYSAGLDSIAKEALLSVHDREVLGSQLLSVVGQRFCHVIVNASESAEQVNRLSRLPTNICSWIKAQDPSKLACRSVPVSCTVDLLSMLLTLVPEQSADHSLACGLAEAIKFLF